MFDIKKYMGTWYELGHYPTFFQSSDFYNTKAEYTLMKNGTVKVVNSALSNGEEISSTGSATQVAPGKFKVGFPIEESSSNIGMYLTNIPDVMKHMIELRLKSLMKLTSTGYVNDLLLNPLDPLASMMSWFNEDVLKQLNPSDPLNSFMRIASLPSKMLSKLNIPYLDSIICPNSPNYVVDKIFEDKNGGYRFAIVTNPSRTSLWILSRTQTPCLNEFNRVMHYVEENFSTSTLIQTPQYVKC
jgi:lipocalin